VTRRARIELASLLVLGILPYELNGFYNPRLASHPTLFWTIELFTWVVMPAAIYAIARGRRLVTPREIGLSANLRGRPAPVLLVLLSVALTIGLYHLDRAAVRWGLALWPTNPGHVAFKYDQMLPWPGSTTGWLRILAWIYLGVSGGLVEEMYYRGMMRRIFAPGWIGATAFVAISALVFASVHWEFGVVVMFEALIFAVAAGIVYAVTENLWPLIVAHTVIDCLWLINF
jgi:membrane protease YdiL (CAAX protease family)